MNIFCMHCGQSLPSSANFCRRCGRSVQGDPTESTADPDEDRPRTPVSNTQVAGTVPGHPASRQATASPEPGLDLGSQADRDRLFKAAQLFNWSILSWTASIVSGLAVTFLASAIIPEPGWLAIVRFGAGGLFWSSAYHYHEAVRNLDGKANPLRSYGLFIVPCASWFLMQNLLGRFNRILKQVGCGPSFATIDLLRLREALAHLS